MKRPHSIHGYGVARGDRVRVVSGPRAGVEGVVSQIFPAGTGRPEPRAMLTDSAGTFPSVELSRLEKIGERR